MTTATSHDMIWEPTRRLTLEEARRRSRQVMTLRRVFVALAGASLASVFVFMALFSQAGLFGPSYSTATPLRVINPRFTGTNGRGEAYQVTADAAVRSTPTTQLLDLAAPIYRTIQGQTLIAPQGTYDERTETVRMEGGVLFNDPRGNRFSSPSMIIDLQAGVIHGERGVTGAGPLGVISADSYEMSRDSGTVTFRSAPGRRVTGQVPERAEPAPPPAPAR